jgi:hypothetical protein
MQRHPDSSCTIDHTTTIHSHHCQRPCRSLSPPSPQELPGKKSRRTCAIVTQLEGLLLDGKIKSEQDQSKQKTEQKEDQQPDVDFKGKKDLQKETETSQGDAGKHATKARSRLYDAVTLLRHCDSNRLTLLSTFVDCVPANLFNSNSPQEWVDTPKCLWRTGITSGWRGWGDPTKGTRTLCVIG